MQVGDLCLKSAERESGGDPAKLSRVFSQAIRHYLADRDAGRVGWSYPHFLLDAEESTRQRVSIEVDTATWKQLLAEAERQETSPDQLLEHAVLYLAADRDSGRLTERILEDSEE